MRMNAMLTGLCAVSLMAAAEPANESSPVRMLIPGFTVQELTVRVPGVNQLRFAPDGRLFALGQDGRIYLLRDTNGAGLENRADVFWERATNQFTLAIWPATEGVFLASPGIISLLTDTNHDGRADGEKVLARLGDGAVVTSLTRDAASNIFFTVGSGGGNSTNSDRGPGTVQRLAPDGALTTFATGLRGPGTLRFNRAGDLFLTGRAREGGEGWDELNHMVAGKDYGSASHPQRSQWPVVAFGPAPQVIGGLVFNEPSAGPGAFGPAWWQGDALVAGAARGKIWRVRLVKTAHGYIGREYPIASVNQPVADLALSPGGALYVSTTNGLGGRLFKITYTDRAVPQPVLAASFHPRGAFAYFDRELDDASTNSWAGTTLDYGEQVRAGDRWELISKTGLAPRRPLRATVARLSRDRRALLLLSEPYPDPVMYAFALSGISAAGSAPTRMELAFDHSGVEASWTVRAGGSSGGEVVWLPHLGLPAAQEWMRGTCVPDILRRWVETGLTNELRSRLELKTHLKFPSGQYTLHFESDVKFAVTGEFLQQAKPTNQVWVSQSVVGGPNTLELTWAAEAGHPHELDLAFARLTKAALPTLEVYYTSAGDATRRPIPATWLVNPPDRPHRH